MKRIRRLPTPAMVVAFIALFAALAGGAYAAKKIGSKSLRNNAVTSKKINNGAVTNRKIKNGAVSAGKLRDGAVGTTKIGDAAVAAAKLVPNERSEGFVSNREVQIPLPAATATTVATLNLPTGTFTVTAGTALGGAAAVQNLILCDLRDDGTVVTTGSGVVALAVFMETVTLTGTSNGGVVSMTCTPDAAAFARSRTITATRVASLQAQ